VDKRCDLYSVGVILYELLTGCRPYEIVHFPIPSFKSRNPAVNVAPEIEKFVLRCMDRDPNRRPASAFDLAEEFRALVEPAITDSPNVTADRRLFAHSDRKFPTRLTGKFEPLGKLGEGGMGTVWRVRHRELGEERAIKLIGPALAGDESSKDRFRREAQAMARSRHPHVVFVHDVRTGQVPYIEMEYVRGKSLQEELAAKVPLPLEKVTEILTQLCDVLQHAHDQGIIHRDLKPSNLMLVESRHSELVNLKVLDFGLAKMRRPTADDPFITQAGTPLGTLLYMSPEQLIDATEVTPLSDVYSVGVILYEMLTGRRPFTSENRHALQFEIDSFAVPSFKDRNPDANVAPELESLVLRCLAIDPSERPRSARALAEEFRELAEPERLAVSDPVVAEPAKLDRRWFLAGAGTVAIAGLGVGFYAWARKPASEGTIVPPPDTGATGDGGTVIDRPREKEVVLPVGWNKAQKADTFKENGIIYPTVIERIFKDTSGKEHRVVAVLVQKKRRNLDEFYIMKDKVWIGLFQAFSAGIPEKVRSTGWYEKKHDNWPALGVSGDEAEACATWLGGRLPTADQWDEAAGKNWNKKLARLAPFQESGPLDALGVAVGLDSPRDVGTSARDISPYGCRDMSGNGLEWVSPDDKARANGYVSLRAASYKSRHPFLFEYFDKNSGEFHEPSPEVGFRVVIEPQAP
jgi:serine/threonine protein kinase